MQTEFAVETFDRPWASAFARKSGLYKSMGKCENCTDCGICIKVSYKYKHYKFPYNNFYFYAFKEHLRFFKHPKWGQYIPVLGRMHFLHPFLSTKYTIILCLQVFASHLLDQVILERRLNKFRTVVSKTSLNLILNASILEGGGFQSNDSYRIVYYKKSGHA